MIPGTNRPRVRHGRRVAGALAAISAVTALAAAAPIGFGTASAAPTAALADRLAQAGPAGRIAVIATFADQVPEGAHDGRPAALLRALRSTAASPPRSTARCGRSGS